MINVVKAAAEAIVRGLSLCKVLDRAHSHPEVYQAFRSARYELQTAQDLLSRLGADILAPRDGQAGTDAPETSQAAARAMRTRSGGQRHIVLRHLQARGRLADFQMQKDLALAGSSQRPRRYELARAGYIQPSTDEHGKPYRLRNPQTHQLCDTWELTASGRAALALLEAGQMALFTG